MASLLETTDDVTHTGCIHSHTQTTTLIVCLILSMQLLVTVRRHDIFFQRGLRLWDNWLMNQERLGNFITVFGRQGFSKTVTGVNGSKYFSKRYLINFNPIISCLILNSPKKLFWDSSLFCGSSTETIRVSKFSTDSSAQSVCSGLSVLPWAYLPHDVIIILETYLVLLYVQDTKTIVM